MALPASLTSDLASGLSDVVLVAGLVYVIIAGLSVFKRMRSAVGGTSSRTYSDRSGNEYRTVADRDEAESRTSKAVWVNPAFNPDHQFTEQELEDERIERERDA